MGRLLAVARNTFIEATRARVTAIFALVLALGLLTLPMLSTHGTLIERVQTFLAYSLGLTILLLSVLTLLLGCGLLCGEIRRRHIFTPLTKPVARWQYLLGRWLGLVVLQAVLCAAAGAAIYGETFYMKARCQDKQQLAELNDQLLVARARHSPIPINLLERAQERIKQLTKDNRLQQAVDAAGGGEDAKQKVYQQICDQVTVESQTAQPFGVLQWEFEGLQRPAGKDAVIQFSFKLEPSLVPPDAKLIAVWRFENPVDNRPYVWAGVAGSRVQTTITLPAEVVGSNGRLKVFFQNIDPRDPRQTFPTSVTVSARDTYILYPVGTFTPNFFRGIVDIFWIQFFLASLALAAASFLSFPVASLVCFALTVVGLGASYVLESTNLQYNTGFWAAAGHYTAAAILFLLPSFATASPTDAIVGGVVIPWVQVALVIGTFTLQTCIAMALAWLLFRRRELARVTA